MTQAKNKHDGYYFHKYFPYHGLHIKSQQQVFAKIHDMAKYWIDTQKILAEIQFNTISMIISEQGHTR